MSRSKVQKVVLTVRFDKPVTRTEAVQEVRDCIHGTFYPGAFSHAEEMRIGGVSPAPKRTAKP